MKDALINLLFFSAKAFIIVALILFLFLGILVLIGISKEKLRTGIIHIKNLNEKYAETSHLLSQEILPKKTFKTWLKALKSAEKIEKTKNVFVLNFHGDVKASAVTALREEITAILGVAKPEDEVILRLESPGGMVHAYGLAASQLVRIREKNIPLTVIVDKVAASGGYLMACVANKIFAAPFAILGSIGVIVQIPNFHRLLKEKNVDFEQLTAGAYKRTLTMFGANTPEGREKLRAEIEEIHTLFKNMIKQYRQHLDIEKVATGEHWLGAQALELALVDELKTSDDYLLTKSKEANLFEITYQTKKSLTERLSSSMQMLIHNFKNYSTETEKESVNYFL